MEKKQKPILFGQLSYDLCCCLKDDMEASGEGFRNRLPGERGVEGRQVSTAIEKNQVLWKMIQNIFNSLKCNV